MSSLLHQLNSESLLLMYLSDELGGEDRAEVEQMLGRDPHLRALHDELRDAYGVTREAFEAADVGERLPVPAGGAARRVGQAVRSWHARRLSEVPASPAGPRRGLRYPWWSYPVAAAAALIIAGVSWWGFQDGGTNLRLEPQVANRVYDDDDDDGRAGLAVPPPPSFAAVRPLPEIPGGDDERDRELDAAEEELYAMTSSGGAGDETSAGFLMMEGTDEQ